MVGVAVAALGLAGCLGPGVKIANRTPFYGPGVWRSLGGDNCFWARLRSFTGDPKQDFIASLPPPFGTSLGPQLVQIDASDAAFEQSGCLPFWRQDPPGPYARFLVQGQSFGPGDFLVGTEIQPGTYQNFTTILAHGPQCTWARVRGFHHNEADVIESGTLRPGPNPWTVTIAPGDYGFTSYYCGTFTRVG